HPPQSTAMPGSWAVQAARTSGHFARSQDRRIPEGATFHPGVGCRTPGPRARHVVCSMGVGFFTRRDHGPDGWSAGFPGRGAGGPGADGGVRVCLRLGLAAEVVVLWFTLIVALLLFVYLLAALLRPEWF